MSLNSLPQRNSKMIVVLTAIVSVLLIVLGVRLLRRTS